MQAKRHGDRLSWGDTVFLYLERPGMPLHIAGVSTFEGVIPLDACCEFMESKLPLIPRYLQRVVAPPFNIGLPSWEFDPDFDIRNRVREVKLKTGTDAEFKAVTGKILSQVMDRERPLWDLTLVRGLQGDRTGSVLRVHHCLADGIAGVGIMNLLMDPSPVPPAPAKKKHKVRVPPPQNSLTSLLDGFISSYSNMVEQVLAAHSDALTIAQKVAANGGDWPAAELTRLLPELTAATEPLRFNVTCRGPQKVAWVKLPLADIKAIKDRCGCTVNDVGLALVTAAVRSYLEFHGDAVKGKLFRVMVPVNVRGSDNPAELGNRISLVPVTIPLSIRNPKRLLSAVHQRTEFLKHGHVAELVSLVGGLVGVIATPLQAFAGPIASQLPITPFNLICTNVRGPDIPLYLLGHKMLTWYPYVPVGGNMALNCAILSYDGTTYFGFSGDTHAAPDLWRLEGLLRQSFAELCDVAGTTTARKQTPRKRGKKASAEAPAELAPATASQHAAAAVPAAAKPAITVLPAQEPTTVSELTRKGTDTPERLSA